LTARTSTQQTTPVGRRAAAAAHPAESCGSTSAAAEATENERFCGDPHKK